MSAMGAHAITPDKRSEPVFHGSSTISHDGSTSEIAYRTLSINNDLCRQLLIIE